MPSSLRSLLTSSASLWLEFLTGALESLGRRGARPGAGKTQGMATRRQLEQGICLSQRTFRRRQVTHDRGFSTGVFKSGVRMGPLWASGPVVWYTVTLPECCGDWGAEASFACSAWVHSATRSA